MKRISLIIGIFLGFQFLGAQEIYTATGVKTSFYSSAPIEDIQATSAKGIAVWNLASGEISVKIPIRSFEFRKALMQEHFNEEFMESHKYANAVFKGKVAKKNLRSAPQNITTTVQGILEIHGKQKAREIPVELSFRNEKIHMSSGFEVACNDHDIKIPRILWKNIAEVVQVKVNANFTPSTK